jgi:hypothetical protein
MVGSIPSLSARTKPGYTVARGTVPRLLRLSRELASPRHASGDKNEAGPYRRTKTIISEVAAVVSRWRDDADAAGVVPAQRDKIQNALGLGQFA